MSKNTQSDKFRKVNVEDFDEDAYKEDEADAPSGNDDNLVAQKEAEIKKLTQSGNNMDALKVALGDSEVQLKPPLKHSLTSSLRKYNKLLDHDRNFAIVLDVLTRFRANEVEKAVKLLTPDQVDTLMKYIYRGFQVPTENSCGILLVWHEKAFEVGGLGSIVRVMADRRTV